jgi:hypothetical protein
MTGKDRIVEREPNEHSCPIAAACYKVRKGGGLSNLRSPCLGGRMIAILSDELLSYCIELV